MVLMDGVQISEFFLSFRVGLQCVVVYVCDNIELGFEIIYQYSVIFCVRMCSMGMDVCMVWIVNKFYL